MLDINSIEQACQCEGWDKVLPADVSNGQVLELIHRLRQQEKDAARYRWLRDSTDFCLVARALSIDPCKRAGLLDAVVDEYLK